jgi:hypothetical protein
MAANSRSTRPDVLDGSPYQEELTSDDFSIADVTITLLDTDESISVEDPVIAGLDYEVVGGEGAQVTIVLDKIGRGHPRPRCRLAGIASPRR